MEESFGWTDNEAILALLEPHIWGGEVVAHLSNRKDGGVHHVWSWPLGHFDDQDSAAPMDEPLWSRVDIAWGRYFARGCTFLVWEDYEVRPGALDDAVWFNKAMNGETERVKMRDKQQAYYRSLEYQQRRQQQEEGIRAAARVTEKFAANNTKIARLLDETYRK